MARLNDLTEHLEHTTTPSPRSQGCAQSTVTIAERASNHEHQPQQALVRLPWSEHAAMPAKTRSYQTYLAAGPGTVTSEIDPAGLIRLSTKTDLEAIQNSQSLELTLELARFAILDRTAALEASESQLSFDVDWVWSYVNKLGIKDSASSIRVLQWQEGLELEVGKERIQRCFYVARETLQRMNRCKARITQNWNTPPERVLDAGLYSDKPLSKSVLQALASLSEKVSLSEGKALLLGEMEFRVGLETASRQQRPRRGHRGGAAPLGMRLTLADVKAALDHAGKRQTSPAGPHRTRKRRRVCMEGFHYPVASADKEESQSESESESSAFERLDTLADEHTGVMEECAQSSDNGVNMELSDTATGAPEDHEVKDATKDTDVARSADAEGFDPNVCAPEAQSHLSPVVEKEAEDDSLNSTDSARGAERTIDAKDEADSRQSDRCESESERYDIDITEDVSVEMGRSAPPIPPYSPSSLASVPLSSPEQARLASPTTTVRSVLEPTTPPFHMASVQSSPTPFASGSKSSLHSDPAVSQNPSCLTTSDIAVTSTIPTADLRGALISLRPQGLLSSTALEAVHKLLPHDQDVFIFDPSYWSPDSPRRIESPRSCSSARTLFLPIHHKNTHWTLAVFNRDTHVIEYYDSLPGNVNSIRTTSSLLLDFLSIDRTSNSQPWTCEERSGLEQPNTWDCGVYVLVVVFIRLLVPTRDLPRDIDPALWRQAFRDMLSGSSSYETDPLDPPADIHEGRETGATEMGELKHYKHNVDLALQLVSEKRNQYKRIQSLVDLGREAHEMFSQHHQKLRVDMQQTLDERDRITSDTDYMRRILQDFRSEIVQDSQQKLLVQMGSTSERMNKKLQVLQQQEQAFAVGKQTCLAALKTVETRLEAVEEGLQRAITRKKDLREALRTQKEEIEHLEQRLDLEDDV